MTVLEDIIAGVRVDLARREAAISLDDLKERAAKVPSALDAVSILRPSDHRSVQVIAEVGAHPDEELPASLDPAELAGLYEDGGAATIAVPTNASLGGSLADLDAVRAQVDIPLLRKDFIVTPYQIWEARAHGADLVFVIVAALEDTVLTSLIERVHSLGMTALVEVRNRPEALRALDAGAHVIGIANDAKTADNMRTFDEVADVIPASVIRVAESGVTSPQDMLSYARVGADAVLIGEILVTSADPLQTLRDMVAAGQHPSIVSM
ncbi:indole-3-glycerol phosphate synthase TrpC [Trueperella pyogenes]|uniref:indole-3-glycerol phosphate synthase TrpC n=1 Tax=Trueperella pyogenes TaxID=1661 RepID=UPI00324D2334